MESQPREIDYTYETHPDYLIKFFDFKEVLLFCQQHNVVVDMGPDLQFYCWINTKDGGAWSIDLDCFTALVMGIHNYKKHHENKSHETIS